MPTANQEGAGLRMVSIRARRYRQACHRQTPFPEIHYRFQSAPGVTARRACCLAKLLCDIAGFNPRPALPPGVPLGFARTRICGKVSIRARRYRQACRYCFWLLAYLIEVSIRARRYRQACPGNKV